MKRKSFDGNGFCLVLSGGGAKGVYHIGVWKALQEMKIGVDAFFGSSIGAIIAGYLVQGNMEKALEEMGNEISLNYIVDVPAPLMEGGELNITPQTADAYHAFYKKALKLGGLDTSPLRKMLERDLDEKAIRKSGKDLGVVTVNISELKTCRVFLEDMEPGSVLDYLMASSALPGFKSQVIKGKKFIDGGVVDNIPYRMARERGYRKIIVVDISGVGLSRKPDTEGTVTVFVKNSIDMGGILDFSKEFLYDYRELGYLDTLKTFGYLKGNEYFIEPSPDGDKILKEVLTDSRYVPSYEKYISRSSTVAERKMGVREILPSELRSERDIIYPFIDCAASILKLERIRRYELKELAALIRETRAREDEKLRTMLTGKAGTDNGDILSKVVKVAGSIKKMTSGNETPYYYYKMAEKISSNLLPDTWNREIIKLFPQLNAGLLFLDILELYDS